MAGIRFHDSFMKLLLWREKHLSERTFVLFLALLTGIAGGFAAVLLKV